MPFEYRGLGIHGTSRRRKRHLVRDNILGITKPAIRRLARRGGIKRMSASIYHDIRLVTKLRLTEIIEKLVLVMDSSATAGHQRKTITVRDVVFVLNRMGNPVYGFDPR